MDWWKLEFSEKEMRLLEADVPLRPDGSLTWVVEAVGMIGRLEPGREPSSPRQRLMISTLGNAEERTS